MAQGTVNPGRLYGWGSVLPRAVVVALVAAVAIAALVMAGPNPVSRIDGASTAVPAGITQVDDFVTRRYLSNPAPADDSWKDDHITRRYLPGD
ncbi:MAG TPA: hypothetical protein VLB67_09440 [Acidimicrobiia bacterium]|nr:hypothetical protein [Acidimicrobiia bacterium]